MPETNARTGGSEVDPRVPRAGLRDVPWATLAAISAGGVVGATARHAIGAAFPHRPGTFGWATFAVNVVGCLLIGMLMVAISEVWPAPRLVRPFLGIGVLGGFTTFSAYVVDIQQAVQDGAPRTALVYLAATPVSALTAVYAGTGLMRLRARRDREGRS